MTTSEIRHILIAYLDDETTIVGTVMNGDVINFVLSIPPNEYNKLDRDQIARDLENELQDKYGADVEVTIKQNEDGDDSQDKDADESIILFISQLNGKIIYFAAGFAIVTCICFVICLGLCAYLKRKRRAQKAVINMAQTVTKKTAIGTNTDTTGGPLATDTNAGATSGSLAINTNTGATGGSLATDTNTGYTDGNETDGEETRERSDSEELYDVENAEHVTSTRGE